VLFFSFCCAILKNHGCLGRGTAHPASAQSHFLVRLERLDVRSNSRVPASIQPFFRLHLTSRIATNSVHSAGTCTTLVLHATCSSTFFHA
jgi:hypothetical protein